MTYYIVSYIVSAICLFLKDKILTCVTLTEKQRIIFWFDLSQTKESSYFVVTTSVIIRPSCIKKSFILSSSKFSSYIQQHQICFLSSFILLSFVLKYSGLASVYAFPYFHTKSISKIEACLFSREMGMHLCLIFKFCIIRECKMSRHNILL